jgi:hypothetical protein
MKQLYRYIIVFLLGFIVGFLIFSLIFRQREIIIPKVVTITKTIKEPHYIVEILKEKEGQKVETGWFLHTFQDSILQASIEAKTDSVRNFKYTIFKYPIIEITKEKEIEKLRCKKWLIYTISNFGSINFGLGYRFLSIGASYDFVRKEFKPSIGLFLNF